MNGHVLAIVKVDLPVQLADDPQHLNVPTPTHHLHAHAQQTHTHKSPTKCGQFKYTGRVSTSNYTHMEIVPLFVVIPNKHPKLIPMKVAVQPAKSGVHNEDEWGRKVGAVGTHAEIKLL